MKQWLLKHAARYLIEQKQKPVTHTDLAFSGVDSTGTRYYGFDDLSLLPNCRRIELEKASLFMDARLDPQSLETISERIREAADAMRSEGDIKKRTSMQAKIIAYTEELARRERYAIPKYFYIEIAAILNVSEHEDPAKFDRELHNKKAAQFEKELSDGNAFFFRNRVYVELMNLSAGLEPNLTNLFSQWAHDEEHQKARLKAISSFND